MSGAATAEASASTGSSGLVSGWTSMPSRASRSALLSNDWNLDASPSRRSMGDQPAILPATIPAIAAAGPKAEFERDRPLRRVIDRRDSGVGGARLPPSCSLVRSPVGVPGIELARDLEALLERGRKSRGCCSLYLSTLRRPPLMILRKVSSSLISSSAGCHSNCLSSSETSTAGAVLRLRNLGTTFRAKLSGMERMIMAIGVDRRPRTKEIPHWGPLSRWTENAAPPTKTIRTWPATMMN